MNDIQGQVEGLRRRLRLQSLMSVGVLVILMFAMGGADTVARTLVESDAWRVKTKKADLVSYADRIIATTDVNKGQVKINDANLVLTGTDATTTGNIVLASQSAAPTSPVAGTLWYDSGSGKFKYYNGSAWVESGGGGVDDAFRLSYNSATTLALVGIGKNGGSVNIDGTNCAFASTVVSNTASVANTIYYAYAYLVGTTVTLELSTTVPTANQYGVYATKTGDVSRRYVGMGHYTSGSAFSAEFVRSVKNERGYAYIFKHAPATGITPSTANTAWTDLDPVLTRTGLFFDQERIRAWAALMPWTSGQWAGRECRLGISVSTTVVEDSELSASLNTGGYWALPCVSYRSEAYVTISGAGIKSIKPIHKTQSGSTSQWIVDSTRPAQIGFEVLR
jgi:hypothetical protein